MDSAVVAGYGSIFHRIVAVQTPVSAHSWDTAKSNTSASSDTFVVCGLLYIEEELLLGLPDCRLALPETQASSAERSRDDVGSCPTGDRPMNRTTAIPA